MVLKMTIGVKASPETKGADRSSAVSYTHLSLVLFRNALDGSTKAIPAGSALGEIRTAHELSLIHI